MKGKNASFRSNPKKLLKGIAVECYNIKQKALEEDLKRSGVSAALPKCDRILEFDFVPIKVGNYVSLQILGPIGTYALTKRKGKPVVAGWIPYLGQKAEPDPSKFGRINLSSVVQEYVFTAGLNGCHLIAVRDTSNDLILYHEPTAAEWGDEQPNYDGQVELKAGPDYALSEFIGGFGVAVRRTGGWKLLIQTTAGTKVIKVDEYNL